VGTRDTVVEEGKVSYFDSFEHEVWNSSLTLRAVLIIDVWHPDLTAAESWALEQL
jgi:aspartate beta-hydroxylase